MTGRLDPTNHRLEPHLRKAEPPARRNKPKKEKRPPQPIRLSFPSLGGSPCLDDLVRKYGGVQLVAKHFHLTESLLRKWISGELEPPLTVLLAIYWQSPIGMEHAFSESHWTNQYNCFKARDAEAKVATMTSCVQTIIEQLQRTHPEALASLDWSPFLALAVPKCL